jgi:hypothetical protein
MVSTRAGIRIGTTLGGSQLGSAESAYGPGETKSISFVGPDSGVVYVQLYTTAGVDCTAHFDDVVLQDTGMYFLTGTPAVLTKGGRIMSAAAGVYVLTGSNATLRISRKITADPGMYSLTGKDARLLFGRRLVADPGVYTMTGNDAAISYIIGYFLRAEKGSYAMQGTPARLLVGRRLVANPGSYAWTGSAWRGSTAAPIRAAPGSYAMNGTAARLLVGYRLAATPRRLCADGHRRQPDQSPPHRCARLVRDAGHLRLIYARRLVATPGVYLVTGTNAALLAGRRLAAAPGAYSLTGSDARLLSGGSCELLQAATCSAASLRASCAATRCTRIPASTP